MTNTSDKKPHLRFVGYSDAWSQHKLNELVERVVRKNTNNESSLPLTISAQDGLVDQITYFNSRVASKDVSNYYLVYNGEFAYNKSTSDGFPVGAVKRLDRYQSGVLSILYIVFSIRDEAEVDSDFLTVFFDTDRWHKYVSERAAEGARNHGLLNISADDFLSIPLYIPSSESEQAKIGVLLHSLNNCITLHRQEYEKLVKVKNSLLEKMFPAEGETKPQIRFRGHSNAWEQRKVEDVAVRYDNLRIPVAANLRVHGNTPYYGANGIQDYVDGYTHDGEFVLVAEDGANDLKDYPIRFVNGRIWVNNHAHVLQGKNNLTDNKFLAFSIKRADIESLIVGGSRAKLNAETLMDIDISLPNIAEQIKIGNLFIQIDRLITLHQRTLEKVNDIKKSLLERMFV